MAIKVRANAKINLLLDLTGVFPDGYHGIYTVMQSVGLYDTVSVEKAASGITVECSGGENIPLDDNNTAYKAALRFAQYTGTDVNVTINIEKNIPSGAGMAGGSADAAAVIRALDKLYGTALTPREMCAIGVKVGADVPFCITGGTALAQNIGELLAPMPELEGYEAVITKPMGSVSTAAAYAAYDKLRNVRHTAREFAVNAYMSGDIKGFFEMSSNVFEQAVEVPGRAEIKAVMRACGSDFAQMTGSGSAVFGLFSDPVKAENCVKALAKAGRSSCRVPLEKKGLAEY